MSNPANKRDFGWGEYVDEWIEEAGQISAAFERHHVHVDLFQAMMFREMAYFRAVFVRKVYEAEQEPGRKKEPWEQDDDE